VKQARILLVDDEDLVRFSLKDRLGRQGYSILEAGTVAEARQRLADDPDLVLLDHRLPDGTGLELLREIKSTSDLQVVMATAHGSVPQAVEAMRIGAFDYISKPFDMDELVLTVKRALESDRMRRELSRLRTEARQQGGVENILGTSVRTRELKEMVRKIAQSPASTILLTGESGVGKGLVARAIHFESDDANQPFVNITCTALPESLMESELFGHERGAFTDARVRKQGLFEMADGGTVFLDEIGDMPLALQGKLLRFLEEKTFRRVGGVRDISVELRIIAATNKEMEEEVRAGRFRADLYYRIKVIPIEVPPLRERPADIPILVDASLREFAADFKKTVLEVSPAAMEKLTAYAWPGNVRELRNTMERSMLLIRGGVLRIEDLPPEIRGRAGAAAPPASGAAPAPATTNGDEAAPHPRQHPWDLPQEGVPLDELEKSLLIQALERTGHNQTKAGKLLGINRDQVRYRLEKYGLRKRSGEE
jgi:DNA-binding NtrC family response regulator